MLTEPIIFHTIKQSGVLNVVSKFEKLLFDIMCGYKDQNILFQDLCKLLEALDFTCRIRGDHYIFTRSDIVEILNIQPKGNKAKAYQVKQIRNLLLKYQIGGRYHV